MILPQWTDGLKAWFTFERSRGAIIIRCRYCSMDWQWRVHHVWRPGACVGLVEHADLHWERGQLGDIRKIPIPREIWFVT